LEVVIGEEVIKEDEEELRHRQERSHVVVKELSDLVNYVIPRTFEVSAVMMGPHLNFHDFIRGLMLPRS
jgi:hypothetical protein